MSPMSLKFGWIRRALRFFTEHSVDRMAGGWFWSIRADGAVNRADDKAGFWECPCHNSRMCLEAMACAEAEKDRPEGERDRRTRVFSGIAVCGGRCRRELHE